MTPSHPSSTADAWARFRFSVVGSLLSSPHDHGALKTAIGGLAAKTWSHPVTGRDVRFSAVTIERWYYTALHRHDDPVAALRRTVRKDCGQIDLAPALAEQLGLQYRQYPHWSYQLHYDNLAAWAQANPSSGRLPSYSTVKRYMQAHGWMRRPRLRLSQRPGELRAEARRQTREIRSYQAEYVGALWHLDFHHGSLNDRRQLHFLLTTITLPAFTDVRSPLSAPYQTEWPDARPRGSGNPPAAAQRRVV